MANAIVLSKIYDKRDDFNFEKFILRSLLALGVYFLMLESSTTQTSYAIQTKIFIL